jgi:putative inorganic carbon (hco3(-)) transporter
MYVWWQRLALSNVPLAAIYARSYVHRWIGSLAAWREGSWLLQWGEAIGSVLAMVLFAVAPFISNDAIGIVLIAAALWWFLLSVTDDRGEGVTPLHVSLTVFWFVAAISASLSPAREAAIGGIFKLSLYLFFFAFCARILRSPAYRNWVISTYLLVSLAVSAYGLNQVIYGAKALATWVDVDSPLAKTTRAYSYLNNPNLLAGYLLPAIAFSAVAIFVWRSYIAKGLAGFILIANIICLYGTQSRGAWIGGAAIFVLLLTGLFYWIRPYLPIFLQRWGLLISLGGSALSVVLLVLAMPAFRERILSIFNTGDSSNNFRTNVWKAIRRMIADRPLIGFGPGDRVFKKMYPVYQVSPRYSALSAYSIFFETVVEMGFLGLAAFLWTIAIVFDRAWQAWRRFFPERDVQVLWLLGAISAVIGLLIQGASDTVWFRPELNILWWLCLGIIASFPINSPNNS